MLGLDCSFQVERQKFSEPLIPHRTAANALNDIQVRRFIDFDQARPVIEQCDIPADHYLIGESTAMCISYQIKQLLPAWEPAMQYLHACFGMPLIPPVYRGSPGPAGGPSQFTGMDVDIGCNSPRVVVIDDDGTASRHAKDRIGDFEIPLLIPAAHHADCCQSAIAKVSDVPMIHQSRLY
jgi:hypothetical protein